MHYFKINYIYMNTKWNLIQYFKFHQSNMVMPLNSVQSNQILRWSTAISTNKCRKLHAKETKIKGYSTMLRTILKQNKNDNVFRGKCVNFVKEKNVNIL